MTTSATRKGAPGGFLYQGDSPNGGGNSKYSALVIFQRGQQAKCLFLVDGIYEGEASGEEDMIDRLATLWVRVPEITGFGS
jgi:hypothetical protein